MNAMRGINFIGSGPVTLVIALTVAGAIAADDDNRAETEVAEAADSIPPATQPAEVVTPPRVEADENASRHGDDTIKTIETIPDPKQVGGEPAGVVQVANLVYAGTMSSKCFSDHVLSRAEKDSALSTSRRFHAVKLSDAELFNFPLVIMTGEGDFTLPDQERENLRKFVERGGLLLASAGCSSAQWDRSFRREMAAAFPDRKLNKIDMDHPVFHMVYDITHLRAKTGRAKPLETIMVGGRIGVIYSRDGLNDTEHTTGCCCCGGNEIKNAVEVNVNILAYALIY